jgi:cytochrome c-type biogenesis protein CcmF
VVPMLGVLSFGPLLRWRRDRLARIRMEIALPLLFGAIGVAVLAARGIGLLPAIGMALAAALAIASWLPLRGRELRRVKLPLWGMVIAHFGVSVALFGIACDSAFTTERLVAARVGEQVEVGPWQITLTRVDPVAGPNWTALQAQLQASYRGANPTLLKPQARSFWTPPQQTSESALLTRWNGQLYTVLGDAADGNRWQLRLWWKPFVPMIWYGGVLIALGGLLALFGRVASDVRRLVARDKIAYRRMRQGR